MLRSAVMMYSAIILSYMAFSQPKAMVKYRDLLYTVYIKKNITYYTSTDASVKEKYHLFDLYEPNENNADARPLIIWMHGGGFKYGNKKTGGLPLWCKDFSKRGYICASINYRLSKKKPLRKFPDLVEGCMDAVEDLQHAIRYFKENCREYKIDTTKIIVAGNSAGAMTGLQAVYGSPYEMMQLINKPGYENLSKLHNPEKISAIISFWGALFDSNWLKNENIPIVSAHGTKDNIVKYDHQGPVSGSLAIHHVADSLHIPNALKSFQGYGHELQRPFNPLFAGKKTKQRWKQAGDFAADFLYSQLFTGK